MTLPQRTFRVVRGPDEPTPLADHTADQLLTIEEVAERLRMSRSTAYGLAQRGALPVVRFAGSKLVRVSARALDRYIAAQVQS